MYGALQIDAPDVLPQFGRFGDTDPCTEANANHPGGWSPNTFTCFDPTITPAMAKCCVNHNYTGLPGILDKATKWVESKVIPSSSSSTTPPKPSGDTSAGGGDDSSSSSLLPALLLGGAAAVWFWKKK